MTPGGAILLAATAGIAWLVGGLPACVVGGLLGGGTYMVARRNLNTLPGRVLQQQKAALEARMNANLAGASPEQIREAKKEMAIQLQSFEAVQAEQRWGNKELAACAGVAAFACPVLGAVALAGLTADHWAGPVTRACEGDPRGDLQKEVCDIRWSSMRTA